MKALFNIVVLAYQRVAPWARDLAAIVRGLAIPLLFSVLTCLVLVFPPQSTELYRSLVESLTGRQTEFAAKLASPDRYPPDGLVCFPGLKFPAIETAVGEPLGKSACYLGYTVQEAAKIFGPSLASLLLLASCLFFITALFVAERGWKRICTSKFFAGAVLFAPAVIASAPLVAISIGIMRSRYSVNLEAIDLARKKLAETGDTNSGKFIDNLHTWFELTDKAFHYVLIIAAIVFFCFSVLFLVRSRRICEILAREGANIWAIVRTALLISIGLTVAAIVAIAAYPVGIGQALGAISVVCLFVSLLSLNITGLNFLARRIDFPIVFALILIAIVLSITNLNDNHQLRRIDANGQTVVASEFAAKPGNMADPRPVAKEFAAWYSSRADKDNPEFEASGYPVYIVASQGGGIYAAAQTLVFLTRMYVACPRFAQHVFAISSVSGGSVGAAFYEALAGRFNQTVDQCPSAEDLINHPTRPPDYLGKLQNEAMKLILKDYDYLSPLVAAALFPDFLQRFIIPPVPALSRERALEMAIEEAWEDVSLAAGPIGIESEDALRKGIMASWKSNDARPALVINTTEVGSGRRRVIAPFKITSRNGSDLKMLPISRNFDVPISAAAVASARFPWITPAAWFLGESDHQVSNHTGASAKSRPPRRYWVVDGGYFDNSGVATAVDIIDSIDPVVQQYGGKIQINLIVITSGGFSDQATNPLGEFLSPLLALFNSRPARTYSTIELAERRVNFVSSRTEAGGFETNKISRLHKVRFDDFIVPLPLGWRLSQLAASQIFYQSGSPRRCFPDERYRQDYLGPGFGSPDCVALLLLHQLRGDDLGEAIMQDRARIRN